MEREPAHPAPSQRPRLEDVAAVTGLSIRTISRAVRGDPNVRASTRERVLAEAARIGFRVNDLAAGLRSTGKLMTTVGVTIGDFSNPFFAPLLRGIHSVAAEHHYLVLSADAQNDEGLEKRSIHSLFGHRVGGLIIAPVAQDLGYLDEEIAFGESVVFVDSPPAGLEAKVDSVTTTNADSTREAVELLLAHGHSRIGYLGHPRAGVGALERWQGYRDALRGAGVPIDPGLVRDGLITEEDGRRAADSLAQVADAATAVFCDNNRLTTGLLLSEAFRGRPVEIVGFDDFPLATRFGVTTIDSRPFDVGRVGAELLFDRIADHAREAKQIVVPAVLRPRSPRLP
ncbi:MAG: LacI family transcriptional regulator [Propionibacteriaceae bacterium]|jgi:LacI family transcriptional regulator|nr:LacI family transcriptional regulator [Propionibacteriaceae bacterium]